MPSLYDVPAPAKLNLFLHVLGRREDGYHLLQSVFVPIDWCDTLHFERRGDGRLARRDLAAALPPDDLCLRAARALQQASGTAYGADIAVLKRIPSEAGLGGGSSDAASTLIALNRLWGLAWPRARLMALAQGLGADVPFFLSPGPAWVEGVGERLQPLPPGWVPGDYVVLKPAASLSTRDIFSHPLLARDSSPAIVSDFLADHDGFGRNDLEAAARQVCPQVDQALAWLLARFGNSRMTGSGSAVFARAGAGRVNNLADNLVTRVDHAAKSGADGDLPPGWLLRHCRGLAQHPLAGWLAD